MALSPEVIQSLSVAERVRIWNEIDKASSLTASDYSDKFESYEEEVMRRIQGYGERLTDSSISPDEFRRYMEATLRRAYADAYRYGLGASGNPAIFNTLDIHAVRQYITEQYGYLDNFVRQIKSGHVPLAPEDRATSEGRFLALDRAELYAHSIRSAFFAGYVARGKALDKYDWLLGLAEHCEPCIDMANRSPFTKQELGDRRPGPTVCEGLTRCKCVLIKHGDSAAYLRHLLDAANQIDASS